ncbi:DUF5050 domain-containing protein [Lachnospiraceae bacterium 62-35]
MKTCRFCGKELADEALFCKYCGNRYEEAGKPELESKEGAESDAGSSSAGKICPQCGTLNAEEARFCLECGLDLFQSYVEEQELGAGKMADTIKTGRKKKSPIPLIITAILVIAAAAGGIFLTVEHFTRGSKNELFNLKKAELVDNYVQPEGQGVIDLMARNYQPSARDSSAKWDSTVFYRLEDLGGEDDNHLADCLLSRLELVREDNGKPIEYEVYRNKETDEVQKIVSIETLEDGNLELSDYYYQDGKPNFVFRRSDSVYTPSYASIDKTGERYYFAGDQMVKWRWIYEPSVVKQWILELEDTWYTQWAYGNISSEEQTEYDEKEIQVLNEAYNTYEAVLANKPITLIQGRVVDENGDPLEGVEVGIGLIEGGEAQQPEIKLLTDEDGNYAWADEREHGEVTGGQEYFLVFCKKGWVPAIMKVQDGKAESLLGTTAQQTIQNDMILLEEGKDEVYSVTIQAYQIIAQDEEAVMERAFSEEEEEEAPELEDAEVTIYSGVNWLLGEPAAEEKTSSNGKASFELSAGIYTAIIEKDGILPSRKVFLVGSKEEDLTVYAIAQNAVNESESVTADSGNIGTGGNGVWSIILSWDSSGKNPLDLDSSLFTPDKAAKGDRNCINTLNRKDNAGTSLLYDGEGKNACEVITLSSPKQGSYKYYVTNYTDIQSGKEDSDSLSASGAEVTVCLDGVPVRTFTVPDRAGTVWEVFELRNQGIVPIQEVYANTEGKSWWTEDKKLARISERHLKPDWIQSDGEWLYFSNQADEGKLYYCRKDGSDLTKFSEERPLDGRLLVVNDYVYYAANSNGYGAIIRMKNDGSDRTILRDHIFMSEGEGAFGYCLSLMGYADDVLYYWNAPETYGGILALPIEDGDLESSYYSIGEGSFQMAVAGNYIYYIDGAWETEKSFRQKNLKTGEEECLKTGINWAPWSFSIHKGWVYYGENGCIKRMRLAGAGRMEEEQVLADNAASWNANITFLGDICYYEGNDSRFYAMNPDGSGQAAVAEGSAAILDGELYTRGRRWDPIMVSDKNGGNQRPLFDTSSMKSAGAMRAYAEYLERYPISEYTFRVDFACMDVDSDGVNELFILDYPRMSTYPSFSYYKYDGTVADLQSGSADEIAVLPDRGEFVTRFMGNRGYESVSRYRFDGTEIETREWSPFDASTGTGFSTYYNTYVNNKPSPVWVENTSANRLQYLLNGNGTGWTTIRNTMY